MGGFGFCNDINSKLLTIAEKEAFNNAFVNEPSSGRREALLGWVKSLFTWANIGTTGLVLLFGSIVMVLLLNFINVTHQKEQRDNAVEALVYKNIHVFCKGTHKSEVMSILGKPKRAWIKEEGYLVWEYYGSGFEVAQFEFDDDGNLVNMVLNTSGK